MYEAALPKKNNPMQHWHKIEDIDDKYIEQVME